MIPSSKLKPFSIYLDENGNTVQTLVPFYNYKGYTKYWIVKEPDNLSMDNIIENHIANPYKIFTNSNLKELVDVENIFKYPNTKKGILNFITEYNSKILIKNINNFKDFYISDIDLWFSDIIYHTLDNYCEFNIPKDIKEFNDILYNEQNAKVFDLYGRNYTKDYVLERSNDLISLFHMYLVFLDRQLFSEYLWIDKHQTETKVLDRIYLTTFGFKYLKVFEENLRVNKFI